MKGVSSILVLFVALLGAQAFQDLPIQAKTQVAVESSSGVINGSEDDLKTEIENLKAEMNMVISAMRSMVRKGDGHVQEFITSGSIEEDVMQNKEDIVDLRVTDGRHDVLISHAMTDTKYINNTLIPEIRSEIEMQQEEVERILAPVGSIVAWMPSFSRDNEIPSGWQRCDGSIIKVGPFKGRTTPELNTGRFLRGGSDEDAGTTQEDSVQDHAHQDDGHSHTDSGHSHSDSGHSHYMDSHGDGHHFPPFFGSNEELSSDTLCAHNYHEKCGGYYLRAGDIWTVENGKASISTNSANIQTSKSGLSGMSSGRVDQETRPKNMKVVFIMRVM